MKLLKTIFICSLAFYLQGCIFVVGAAAGAAAAAAVYDHRKLEQVNADRLISNTIVDKVNAVPGINDNNHISVTVFNSVVLLTGETTTAGTRDQVEEIAHAVPNVTKVYNEIQIKGATSTLSRASDTWITTKIKTVMLATKDLKSGSIKVVTESGTVFLMGIVTQEQADTAVEIARKVAGVQKVVKVFQYTK